MTIAEFQTFLLRLKKVKGYLEKILN